MRLASFSLLKLSFLLHPFRHTMAYSRSLTTRNWTRDGWDLPSRFRDDYFGVGLSDDDFFSPSFYRGVGYFPRVRRQLSSGGQVVPSGGNEGFRVLVDVGHFSPEEISVKAGDKYVTVTAKHEEKVDEHGFVSREFTRRYLLPEGVEPEAVTSTLGADGILTVEAPSKKQKEEALKEKTIPITVVNTPTTPPPGKVQQIPVQKEDQSKDAQAKTK